MSSETKHCNEQEDNSGNAEFSTQSNESYHLQLALNSNEIDSAFSSSLIEGLRLQRRFKDVAYIKIKKDCVSLRAYDISTSQLVFIKAHQNVDFKNVESEMKQRKLVMKNNPSLFVKLIDYWFLIKDEHSVLFIAMQYLNENIEEYLNKITIKETDVQDEVKLEFVSQIFLGVQQLEQAQIYYINYNLANYLMHDGSPKLSLCGFSKKYQFENSMVGEGNKSEDIKIKIIKLVTQKCPEQKNVAIVGLMMLFITNWLSFKDQTLLQSIDPIVLADQIRKEEQHNMIQINHSTIFYFVFQSILKSISTNSGSEIARPLLYYLDLLSKNIKGNLSAAEQYQSDKKKKSDIYDDSDLDEDNNDSDNESQDNNHQEDIINNKNNMKLKILNPSSIINKYVQNIQNCQLSKVSNSSNQQQEHNEKEEKHFIDESKENENKKLKNDSSFKKKGSRVSLNKTDELKKKLNFKEVEEVGVRDDFANMQVSSASQNIKAHQKSQSLNNQKFVLLNKQNQVERVIVMEDFEKTPAQSQLHEQESEEKYHQETVIQFSDKKNQEKEVIMMNDSHNTPVHSKLFGQSGVGDNNSKVFQFGNKNQEQEKVIIMDETQNTPAASKLFASQAPNQNNVSKVIQFSNKKESEERADCSYHQNNNDIVLEIKDVDDSGQNSSRQQKNLDNSNVVQNPYFNLKKYLFDLRVQCLDVSEININEFKESNDCCIYAYSCVQPARYIRLKLHCILNPMLGKSLLEVIFVPFINVFNKPWMLKKKENIAISIISHLLFWLIKALNIICMLILVTFYLCILFVVLTIVHIIYAISLLFLALILVPSGFVRVFVRYYYKLSDFKSSIIYQRQNSFTWYESDFNYGTAKEFNQFCHKMLSRRYSYMRSPSKDQADSLNK